MRTPLSPEARIFRSNKWIYSIGGVGRDLAYSLYTYFLLTFVLYTKNVNNTELGVISVIIIICRIWDGINDPIMGGIIEKTRSRFGKFKPWILIGAITNAAVLIRTAAFVIAPMRIQGLNFPKRERVFSIIPPIIGSFIPSQIRQMIIITLITPSSVLLTFFVYKTNVSRKYV